MVVLMKVQKATLSLLTTELDTWLLFQGQLIILCLMEKQGQTSSLLLCSCMHHMCVMQLMPLGKHTVTDGQGHVV